MTGSKAPITVNLFWYEKDDPQVHHTMRLTPKENSALIVEGGITLSEFDRRFARAWLQEFYIALGRLETSNEIANREIINDGDLESALRKFRKFIKLIESGPSTLRVGLDMQEAPDEEN